MKGLSRKEAIRFTDTVKELRVKITGDVWELLLATGESLEISRASSGVIISSGGVRLL